jgi:tetratricopeptide (TPR) repeat protein
MRRAAILVLVAAIPLGWFSSCATAGRSAVVRLDAESRQHFDAARYQEAIDVYKAAREDYPKNKAIAADYSRLLNQVFKAGEAAMARSDFEAAGKIYLLLLENVSDRDGLDPSLSFTRASLGPRIKLSRIALEVERANRSVRSGEFQKAIDGFRALIKSFPQDPEPAAKAVAGLEAIKAAGDAALAKSDFAAAEKIYSLLLESASDFGGLNPAPSFTRASLDAGLKSSRIALGLEKTGRNIRSGGFQKAIDGFFELIKSFPKDPGLVAKAVTGLEAIKAAGDEALAKSDFPRAGAAYYALSKSFPLFRGLGKPLSFGREGLDLELGRCRTALTRRGLELYREGELAAAISVWKSLLLFDPDNAQIKKSIESATAQLNRVRSGAW